MSNQIVGTLSSSSRNSTITANSTATGTLTATGTIGATLTNTVILRGTDIALLSAAAQTGTPVNAELIHTADDKYVLNFTIPPGEKGDTGEKGEQGEKGETSTITVGTVTKGETASVVNSGTINDAIFDFVLPQGDPGPQGIQGDIGPAGTITVGTVTASEPGSQPIITNRGTEQAAILDFTLPRGIQGTQGEKGDTSTITIGSVTKGDTASVVNSGTSTDAIFDFVLPKGDKGEQGIQGIQGEIGPVGPDGKAATIQIGTVTSGGIGEASVTNKGTEEDAIFDFVIPQGEQGPQGEKGETGRTSTVKVGTVNTGKAGTPVIISNTGTDEDLILNFTIPQGAKGEQGVQGEQGEQGEQGIAATITVRSVTTGDAGTQAKIYNAGTNHDAIFDFTIPRGDKGETGPQGATGPKGIGISGVYLSSGSHAPGTLDTYTVSFTDGTSTTFQVYNGQDALTQGVMTTSIYDSNEDGIVDNAEKVNSHTVESDVPANAKFTDTVYDDTELVKRVSDIEAKEDSWDGKADKATTLAGYGITDALNSELKGVANGLAELDADGKVPTAQLPSFVDDVVEYDTYTSFPATGESGKIYIALDTNLTYRWGGSAYVKIASDLALGTTSSTAFRGDYGNTAYQHSQLTSGNPHNVTASDVGLGNVGNYKAVSTVASQGLTEEEKANARANIGAGTSSDGIQYYIYSSTLADEIIFGGNS